MPQNKVKKWPLQSEREVYPTRVFRVLEKHYFKPDTTKNFTASVLKCPNWVNIIGINPKGEILLERQYRFGTDRIELEIPGGVIEAGEDPLMAAKREMKEETGYVSDQWHLLGVVNANPAIMTNQCFSYLALNLQPKGEIHFDADEEIEYLFKPAAEVRADIRNGIITNVFIIAAFHWLTLKNELD